MNAVDRKKMILAMEYIARQVNDEEVFMDWLSDGFPDGALKSGEWNVEKVDDDFIEDETFRGLMDCFLNLMSDAKESGGLYCDDIVTTEG